MKFDSLHTIKFDVCVVYKIHKLSNFAECQQKKTNKCRTFQEGSNKFWAGKIDLKNYKLVVLNIDFE